MISLLLTVAVVGESPACRVADEGCSEQVGRTDETHRTNVAVERDRPRQRQHRDVVSSVVCREVRVIVRQLH